MLTFQNKMSLAQSDTLTIKHIEPYVVELNIKEVIKTKKEKCLSHLNSDYSKKYSLCEVNITNSYMHLDSSIYKSEKDILSIKYAIILNKELRLLKKDTVCYTAVNSFDSDFIILIDNVGTEISRKTIFILEPKMYMTGLMNCARNILFFRFSSYPFRKAKKKHAHAG